MTAKEKSKWQIVYEQIGTGEDEETERSRKRRRKRGKNRIIRKFTGFGIASWKCDLPNTANRCQEYTRHVITHTHTHIFIAFALSLLCYFCFCLFLAAPALTASNPMRISKEFS